MCKDAEDNGKRESNGSVMIGNRYIGIRATYQDKCVAARSHDWLLGEGRIPLGLFVLCCAGNRCCMALMPLRMTSGVKSI